MKEFTKNVWLHIAITLFVLAAYLILDLYNDFRLDSVLGTARAISFNITDAIEIRILLLRFFLPALIPLLIVIFWVYKKYRQNLLASFFIPLAGALLFPSIMYLICYFLDDRWRALLAVEILIVDLIAFAVNEIIFHLRKKY